eukprot:Unigene8112_Nuclearia_a/m.24883 Unigene8112_Nuclearia_a/g.24883  ORF Unigene8112_Nuclearia_a/g.24883 Unigene8112_Nuclearia_a/m.24883 type:complete len:313 (+) Unigene8112_Nuclearia_a:3109-4047(+)
MYRSTAKNDEPSESWRSDSSTSSLCSGRVDRDSSASFLSMPVRKNSMWQRMCVPSTENSSVTTRRLCASRFVWCCSRNEMIMYRWWDRSVLTSASSVGNWWKYMPPVSIATPSTLSAIRRIVSVTLRSCGSSSDVTNVISCSTAGTPCGRFAAALTLPGPAGHGVSTAKVADAAGEPVDRASPGASVCSPLPTLRYAPCSSSRRSVVKSPSGMLGRRERRMCAIPVSACSHDRLNSSLRRVWKHSWKHVVRICATISFDSATPAGLARHALSTCRIRVSTTSSATWSVASNLQCVTATATSPITSATLSWRG